MPDWAQHVRARLSSLRLSATRESEIVEELSQHLDDRWRELLAGGASPDEATRLALAEFRNGNVLAQYMAPLRQAQSPPSITPGATSGHALSDLGQDLRYAARMLWTQPGFTAAVILTLGLGIGANTAVFSLLNATLFQRLPVADREHLAYVYRGNAGGTFSYPLYAALRDDNQVFEGFAAWSGFAASLNAAVTSEVTLGYLVSGNFFDVLGVTATQGRLFSPTDDVTPSGHQVAVISHESWQTRFGGRPDISGQEIRLNGYVFTIVGVTPVGFHGPRVGTSRHVYVPMMMQPMVRPPRQAAGGQNADMLSNPAPSWLFGVGRLKRGVTLGQARAQLATLATTFVQTVDRTNKPLSITVIPVDEGNPEQRRQMRSVAMLLGGVVGAVLLIACANIANLLLARAASRQRELAVRLAIGAGRTRLVRQLLTESLLLSLIGGGVGLGLAWAVVQFFQATPLPPGVLPFAIDLSIDRRVLLFTLGLSWLTGIVFGVAPALKASRPTLVPALKGGSGTKEESRSPFELKKMLVVAEVALSLLLLIAAGLFVRSLQSAHAISLGFDAEKVVSAPLSINFLRYTGVQGREFYQQAVERVERLPGVEAASVAHVPVMTGEGRISGLMIEGRRGYADEFRFSAGGGVWTTDASMINTNVVGPGFFRTLGIPVVTGRDFNDQDTEGRPRVVIVNETMVRMHFGGDNPIGKRVNFGGAQFTMWREIVGVVKDSKYRTLDEPRLSVAYLPLTQEHQPSVTLYVRTSVPPSSLIGALRREILTMEPNLPVSNIKAMTDTIGESLYVARMGAWLLGVFGGLALVLAAVGTYGVLAFSVARRTREMGIRQALGAEPRNVFLLIVRDGMLLVGVGMIVGLAGGFVGAQSLTRFLYDVPASDVVTFGTTTIILMLVALAACVIPARRAMRVDPATVLRYE